ncbi:MAG: YkgJ family cysteine cluster protein [Myxococcota bacterium]
MTDTADSQAYDALVAKVDAFHAQVSARRAEDLACRRGCDACCRVRLSVSPVEASVIATALAGLDEASRGRLRDRLQERLREQRAGASEPPPRCIMLEDDGSCAVYRSRPLVCRTQGLALRYPPRTFPEEAVMARGGDGSDIVWCPLNFKTNRPAGEDVLEAGRLDEMLVLVNLEHVGGDRQAAIERIALESLVGQLVAG